jgi:hypothetical protein
MAMPCVAVCPPNQAVEMAKPPVLCCIEYPPAPVPPPPPPIPAGAPLRVSAAQTAADTIKITYNQPLVAGPIDPTAFTVTLVGAPGITVVNGSVSGAQVSLVLSAPATFSVGTCAYVPSGTNNVKALDDNSPALAFSGYGVTPM